MAASMMLLFSICSISLAQDSNLGELNRKNLEIWMSRMVTGSKIGNVSRESAIAQKLLADSDHSDLQKAVLQKKINEYIAAGKTAETDHTTTCTPVDMRSQFGDVRTQDGVGWCYAFTVADLASQKLGKRVSAIDVTMAYDIRNPDTAAKLKGGTPLSQINGGRVDLAFKYAQEDGFCLESDLKSECILNERSRLKATLTDIEASVADRSPEKALACYNSVTPVFRSLAQDDFTQILKTAATESTFETLYKFREASCKGKRLKLPNNLHPYTDMSSAKTLIERMDKRLSAGTAVGIGYYSDVLTNSHVNKPTGQHESLVVGRRLNANGECEYLIRNSWGTNCKQYSSDWSCDNGNVWLPATQLGEYLHDITFLE